MRLVVVLLGLLLGVIAGLAVALPIVVVLDIAGVTTSREDLPLHGVFAFVATVWGCVLVGGIAGAVLGWRRSARGRRYSSDQPDGLSDLSP